MENIIVYTSSTKEDIDLYLTYRKYGYDHETSVELTRRALWPTENDGITKTEGNDDEEVPNA